MSSTVTYKGATITTVSNETKTLETAGTWMEDDVTITDVSGGGGGVIIVDTPDSHGGTIREITVTGTPAMLQGAYDVTPAATPQTITPDVGYDGFTSVELYHMPRSLINDWDFTQSLVDSVGGLTATLSGATRDSSGITISAQTQYVTLPVKFQKNMTYELDIASMTKSYSSGHGRILMMTGTEGFIQHSGSQYAVYFTSASSGVWDDCGVSTAGLFNGKTLRMTTEIVKNRRNANGTVSQKIYPNFYLDGNLWFSPGVGQATSNTMMIGSSSGASYITMVVTGFRVYDGYSTS